MPVLTQTDNMANINIQDSLSEPTLQHSTAAAAALAQFGMSRTLQGNIERNL